MAQLEERIQALKARKAEKRKENKAQETDLQAEKTSEINEVRTLKSNVIQLPLWPEPVRAVPNGILRSSLFGVIGRGRRRYLERELIASLEGIEIRYTGQRLDQGDLDAWEAILHALRLQGLGAECRVSSYHLLKLLDKKDTGGNREVLHNRILRLRANAVEIKQGRYGYIGGLLSSAAKDDETGEWIIKLDEKLVVLFHADQFTYIQWAIRNEVAKNPLAQWLHGFYSSHAAPLPIKIETLHELCGSEVASLAKFKQNLQRALDRLVEACRAHDEPFSWEIKGNLLIVSKRPSATQKKHLVKKKQKARQAKSYNPWIPN